MSNKVNVKKVFIRLGISLLLIALVIIGGYFLFRHFGITDMSKEKLREKIAEFGVWGPLIFIIVSFLQVTFVPIPGSITILAGNLLFGMWLSLLYSFIGMFLGAVLAFYLGRALGRPFVNWVVGDKETVENYLKRIKNKEFVVFFFMFLLPLFPDDALCTLAGITKLKWRDFILMQVITRPTSILGTLFFMSGEIIPYHGWGLIVLGAVCVLSIVAFVFCYKNADKINAWLDGVFDKIASIKRK